MKKLLVPLSFAFAVITLEVGCKKADQTTQADTSSSPAASPQAKKGVALTAKWPVGNRYTYRMDLDQHSTNRIPQMPTPIQQAVTMAMTYALSVLKETEEGGRELELEFLANEMEVQMGGQQVLSFDSKESPKDEAQNAALGPLRKMIGSKLRLRLNAQGKVQEVIGADEWVSQLTAGAPDPGMFSQQFNEGFLRQLADFARVLPTNSVTVGQTWPFKADFPSGGGKIAVDTKITFKGWEEHEQHHSAVLDSHGTLSGTIKGPMGNMSLEQGKISGKSWFDPELGTFVDSTSDQTFRVKGDLPGQPAGNQGKPQFTSDLSQKVTVKLVEIGKVKG